MVKAILEVEFGTPLADLDEFRLAKLQDVFEMAMNLKKERKKWVSDAPNKIKPLVTMLHGPLVIWPQEQVGSLDKSLVWHLQHGFCSGDWYASASDRSLQ